MNLMIYQSKQGSDLVNAIKQKPFVTYFLIIFCILIYYHEVSLAHQFNVGLNVLYPLGCTVPLHFNPPTFKAFIKNIFTCLINPRLWQAMFLHANLMHIGSNMVFLLFIGQITERLFGHFRFLLLFLLSGFIGDLSSAIIGQSYSIGASTSLFGLLLAGWVLARKLHNNGLANQLMGLFVVNIIFDFTMPDISLWGHLGGALAGLVLGFCLRPPFISMHPVRHKLWLQFPLSIFITFVLTGLIILL